jgi:hypothetical protein
MKKKKEYYTEEETKVFLQARNNKRNNEHVRDKSVIVWDSGSRGTFTGSIRQQFTGPRRNNFA